MRRVDSDALGVVAKSLGLSGAGAQFTEFADGEVLQVLDVAALVRRGRTRAGTEGIYYAILRNEHAAGDARFTAMNPYELGATGLLAPFPSPMPAGFDIWLLSATMRRQSGSGTVVAGLSVQYAASVQAFGLNDTGTAVVFSGEGNLCTWDDLATSGFTWGLLQEQAGQQPRLGVRLPRSVDTQVVFRSTSSALATYQCQIMLGVFPSALGQDGLG